MSIRILRPLPYLLFLAALVLYADNAYALFDFPLDDAWIHRVYARSIALGRGLAYNGSVQETGSTSPAWVLLTAPWEWLSFLGTEAVVLGVKATGASLALLAIHGVRRIAALLTGSEPVALVAATVFALDPRLVFAALSGMEPILLLALLLGAVCAILEDRPRWLAFGLGIAMITRPEAVVFVPFVALAHLLYHRDHTPALDPRNLALALVPPLAWLVFCKVVTGHALPNTFYAKGLPFTLSLEKLRLGWGAIALEGWGASAAFVPGLLGYLLLVLRGRERFARLALLLLPASCFAFVVAVVGSRTMRLDGYYWTRWTDPASSLLTAFAAIGLAALLVGMRRQTEDAVLDRPSVRWGMRAAAMLASALALPVLVTSTEDRRFHLTMDARAIHALNVRIGRFVRENTPEDAVLAVNDAGAIRYFGERHTLDLMGLNDHAIVHRRITARQAVERADYLVVLPRWFGRARLPGSFTLVQRFEIPPEQYTICHCPGQNEQVLLRPLR